MGKYILDKNGKLRLVNSHSLENLPLGASSRAQGKIRLNVTVLPKTASWLKEQGNASKLIDELVEAAMAGNLQAADDASQNLADLTRENEELKAALSQLQQQSQERRDYQVVRDKVLTGLKLGKQAPGYKSALKALDRFIAEMQ